MINPSPHMSHGNGMESKNKKWHEQMQETWFEKLYKKVEAW